MNTFLRKFIGIFLIGLLFGCVFLAEDAVAQNRSERRQTVLEMKKEKKRQKHEQKRLQKEAKIIYSDTVKLYKADRFPLVDENFIRLDDVLQRITSDKFKRSMQKSVESLQKKKAKRIAKLDRRATKKRKKDQARQAKENKKKAKSGKYKPKTRAYKELIAEADKNQKVMEKKVAVRQRELQKERAQVQKSWRQKIADLYKDAVRLYSAKKFYQAKTIFMELEDLSPNYKSTRSYIDRIDADILEAKAGKVSKKKRSPGRKTDKKRRRIVSDALDAYGR